MKQGQEIHDALVLKTVESLKGRKFTNMKVDLPNFEKPTGISWQNKPEKQWIPDITIKNREGIYLLLEVKSTKDAFKFPEVKEQLKIFNAYSEQHNMIFMLVVPEHLEEYALNIASNWNLTNCQLYLV